ncbi:hypothetical protein KAR91_87250 [Candidatus Pacearchaeota archaeon]|nr:hypothetical protein [Candidatus Pacearchaeota archaeon]
MKTILILILLILPLNAFPFGIPLVDIKKEKPNKVKIDYNRYSVNGRSITFKEKLGVIVCDYKDIRVEVLESNRTNYKNVVIACKPNIIPLTVYHLSDKRAWELSDIINGKSHCMTEEGAKPCPKQKDD